MWDGQLAQAASYHRGYLYGAPTGPRSAPQSVCLRQKNDRRGAIVPLRSEVSVSAREVVKANLLIGLGKMRLDFPLPFPGGSGLGNPMEFMADICNHETDWPAAKHLANRFGADSGDVSGFAVLGDEAR